MKNNKQIQVEKYHKTKKGITKQIYNSQKYVSKRRGYDLPNYTLSELREWIYSQSSFETLYNNWVLSGYKSALKPSCDRINDYKSYTLDNLQLTTWNKNNNRGNKDRKNGINNKLSKRVVQLSFTNTYIGEYYSIAKASHITKVEYHQISLCCRNKINIAGGYNWMYFNDYIKGLKKHV